MSKIKSSQFTNQDLSLKYPKNLIYMPSELIPLSHINTPLHLSKFTQI